MEEKFVVKRSTTSGWLYFAWGGEDNSSVVWYSTVAMADKFSTYDSAKDHIGRIFCPKGNYQIDKIFIKD